MNGHRACRIPIIAGVVLGAGTMALAVPPRAAPPAGAPPSTGPAASMTSTPSQQLQTAIGQYEQNQYAAAIATLRPLLYPVTLLTDADEVLEAHRILAISDYEVGDRTGAEVEFKALLELDPGYQLDPAVDPVEAVNFFAEIRRRSQQEIAQAQAKLREDQAAREAAASALRVKLRERVYVTQTVEHVPFGLTLVPLGIGQFAEDRRSAGWFFLAAETGLGLASAGLYLSLVLRYPAGTRPLPGDLGFIHEVEVLQIASGMGCLLTGAWGIGDAVYHYEPSRVLSTSQRVVTPEAGPSSAPLPAPPSEPTLKPLVIVPFAAPSGGGLLVGGTF